MIFCSHLDMSSPESPTLVIQEANLTWSGGLATVFWKTGPL